MDHVSKEIRSKIMAGIRSRGNATTELPLWAKLLWAADLRGYRKHWRVVGKPDFAWPRPQSRRLRGRLFLARLPLQIPAAYAIRHSGATRSKPTSAATAASLERSGETDGR